MQGKPPQPFSVFWVYPKTPVGGGFEEGYVYPS